MRTSTPRWASFWCSAWATPWRNECGAIPTTPYDCPTACAAIVAIARGATSILPVGSWRWLGGLLIVLIGFSLLGLSLAGHVQFLVAQRAPAFFASQEKKRPTITIKYHAAAVAQV